jgi:hypothetical protein
MKSKFRLRLAAGAFLGLACIGLNGVASAALVSSVGATLTPGSSLNGGTTFFEVVGASHGIDNTWDLTGIQGGGPLTVASIHDRYTSSNGGRIRNALSNGAGAHTASVIFDLGGTFDLDGLALWNGNEDDNRTANTTAAARDKTGRGIASGDFLYSIDGGTSFVAWGSTQTFAREFFDLTVGAGTGSAPFGTSDVLAQVKTLGLVTGVTHIQMDLTNHGGGNIINFNELAFNTATVPEPGTVGLALVGLAGAAVRRRRRRL